VQRRNRYSPQVAGGEAEIAEAVDLIAKAKAPVFYTGGGVINSGPVPAPAARAAGADRRRSPRR
jgi:acetolactate synthase-1/2/3 large subunit